ncbi:MAG: NUDIX hydrolase [Spirochaetae bacterium HGW-Spirochaetae-7]|jgi:8-oxo-dGTP pyrophosphatase MutT (NUDIX family)|nr:MAG: NUDIX hydrolase [Spirochaetae bacterium HGW-Spirochaetae-7]
MNKLYPWIELSSKKLLDCKVFKVSSSERQSTMGKRGTFFSVEAPDWAGVIPVVETPEGRSFVMIRQFRHGTRHLSIEFPGGIVEHDENPATAIARELLEETGYTAELLVPLGILSPNPAFMTNTFHAFVAEGCTLERPQCLDEHEEIEVMLVPEREAIDMIGAEDMGHALMTATLFFYERYMGRLG